MNLLEIPYTTSRHNDWIVMAKNLGAGHYSEDIVQEMYIKLSQIKNPERLIDKENPNQIVGFYVYTCNEFRSVLRWFQSNQFEH
jgi:hypothetical protein